MIAFKKKSTDFPTNAPSANPVYYRTYSRFDSGTREEWGDTCARIVDGIAELGNLDDEEKAMLYRNVRSLKCLPSGRWMWVGGTEWIKKPENYYGGYNCSSSNIVDWESFGLMMNLAMQGCGTGAKLEQKYISQLPPIVNKLNVQVIGEPGLVPKRYRIEKTQVKFDFPSVYINVGDSRDGWVESYQFLLELASNNTFPNELHIIVDVSNVRPKGEKLKNFGGVANPNALPNLYPKVAAILNGAIGRQLNSLECCLLIDEAAATVVAGNIRRSAGLRQFDSDDVIAITAKDNLWQQDDTGAWVIDPKRDALRMANHTIVYHRKPTEKECIDSVRKQYYSGEGAIQWAGEAVARANCDLLQAPEEKQFFLSAYHHSPEYASDYLLSLMVKKQKRFNSDELSYRMGIYGLNPCFAAGTMVITNEGNFPIETLIGKTVKVFDGKRWVEIDNFRVTGENKPVFTLKLTSGVEVTATANHTFILENGTRTKLKCLQIGDRLATHNLVECEEAIVEDIVVSHVADKVYCCTVPETHSIALSNGLLVGQCGEILINSNFCNLSEVHLNQIDPLDLEAQEEAFKSGALWVAALLQHKFVDKRYQEGRDLDPIVGVGFTGLFDFFVNAFGVDWLRWWEAGRPEEWNIANYFRLEEVALAVGLDETFITGKDDSVVYKEVEKAYLERWSNIVHETVWEYCDRNNLRRPNRCTTCKPSGSQSLLTGASSGWHPPKAAYFTRRITYAKNDPVALACIDYGYSVVPSQSDKDENGVLLNDPYDPRCTEWLIEIPSKTNWANLEGVEEIQIGEFPALAQFDFVMQVQKHYVKHNSSATIELTEKEIEPLGKRIHQAIMNDEGYISAALLARFHDFETYPRMPFTPCTKAEYEKAHAEVLARRKVDNFHEALAKHDTGLDMEVVLVACDGGACELRAEDKKQVN